MTVKQWPLRWDLLLRYRLIEIIALWEGRLTTNHLTRAFGIGRQQASKDINTYKSSIAPKNLEYDSRLKGYKPSASFKPVVTSGVADEYLHLLNRNTDLNQTFDSLSLNTGNVEVLATPNRDIRPQIIRPIVSAARQQRRLDVDYVSIGNPDFEGRVIVPHTIVFTGLRWHVRAWCEKNLEYRDFVLSRFRGTPDIMDSSEHGAKQDLAWNTEVTISIKPDTRLSKSQQDVIARDYGMENGELKIPTRGPLVHYALQQLHIDDRVSQGKPSAQQIVISNLSEIEHWLFH